MRKTLRQLAHTALLPFKLYLHMGLEAGSIQVARKKKPSQ